MLETTKGFSCGVRITDRSILLKLIIGDFDCFYISLHRLIEASWEVVTFVYHFNDGRLFGNNLWLFINFVSPRLFIMLDKFF